MYKAGFYWIRFKFDGRVEVAQSLGNGAWEVLGELLEPPV
jgi:hypothetical protein